MKCSKHGSFPEYNECPICKIGNNRGLKPEASSEEDSRAEPGSALPVAPLEIQRLINSLPPDVNKKLSLHDLKRIADRYNTGPCPNCYGGHQRPCQWCGDTGEVTLAPNVRMSDEPNNS